MLKTKLLYYSNLITVTLASRPSLMSKWANNTFECEAIYPRAAAGRNRSYWNPSILIDFTLKYKSSSCFFSETGSQTRLQPKTEYILSAECQITFRMHRASARWHHSASALSTCPILCPSLHSFFLKLKCGGTRWACTQGTQLIRVHSCYCRNVKHLWECNQAESTHESCEHVQHTHNRQALFVASTTPPARSFAHSVAHACNPFLSLPSDLPGN